MYVIGVALFSFGVGIFGGLKLLERNEKNAKKKTKNRE